MIHPEELANARWFKSSHSGQNGTCVETAITNDVAGVRDSKVPDSPVQLYTHREWTSFLDTLKQP